MTKTLNELCCLLVEEFYGSFHSQLFSHLVYHGRLSAPQLAQKSRLPLKQVKCGLAALIQSRLVLHHTTSDGSSTYQANTHTTYELLRIGRLIELARREFGDVAAAVVSSAFDLGFASVAELELETMKAVSTSQFDSNGTEHYNGDHDSESIISVKTTVKALMDAGYLIHVRSAHFQNIYDAKQDAEHHLRGLGSLASAKGRKGALEVEERVSIEFNHRTSLDKVECGHIPDVTSGRKRELHEINGQPQPKRTKINGDTTTAVNGYLDHRLVSGRSDNAVVICLSFSNLVSDVRNTYLANKAKRTLGGIHDRVLSSALSQIPSTNQWSTKNDEQVDLSRVHNDINRPVHDVVFNGHHTNGTHDSNGIAHHNDWITDDEVVSYNQVDRSLALLADSEFRFLKGAYGKEWNIVKIEMDLLIRRLEIWRLVGDRLASPALRVVRMLMDKGKIDEKTLQEIGLLSAKDLRQTLAELKQMGYIDLQEVPREAQRQPNRTIYLWFYDSERVQRVMLESLYKAMARLIQRLKLERKKLSTTLEKVDRSDVRGNEEEIMSTAELRGLRRWQRTEQWILGEVARLDESVMLLRDL